MMILLNLKIYLEYYFILNNIIIIIIIIMSDKQNLTHRIPTENSISTEKTLKEEVNNN